MTEVTFINKGGRLTIECKRWGEFASSRLTSRRSASLCVWKPGYARLVLRELSRERQLIFGLKAPAAGELKVDKGGGATVPDVGCKRLRDPCFQQNRFCPNLSLLRPKRFKAKLVDIFNETSDVGDFPSSTA